MSGGLVLCAAANGYDRVFRSCIVSHRDYARRCGFQYRLVVPTRPVAPADAAWLKVALLAIALEHHRWVLWVDADAEIMTRCPDFREVASDGHHLFLALGHTGRLNSGVIAARSEPEVRAFLELLLDRADEPVPPEDRAPYENGHVIHHARGLPFLGLLDRRWNNTVAADDEDFIRHYTGPLARRSPALRVVRAVARAAEASAALRRRAGTGERARALAADLYR